MFKFNLSRIPSGHPEMPSLPFHKGFPGIPWIYLLFGSVLFATGHSQSQCLKLSPYTGDCFLRNFQGLFTVQLSRYKSLCDFFVAKIFPRRQLTKYTIIRIICQQLFFGLKIKRAEKEGFEPSRRY